MVSSLFIVAKSFYPKEKEVLLRKYQRTDYFHKSNDPEKKHSFSTSVAFERVCLRRGRDAELFLFEDLKCVTKIGLGKDQSRPCSDLSYNFNVI